MEPLVEAVTTGQLREVRRLLGDGVDTNVATESGTPVITYASLHGLENVAKALIDEQADLNAQNRAGATALMYAAQFQHNGIVDALIEGGADVNAQDSVGWTPLIYAVVGANAAAVTALVEGGSGRQCDWPVWSQPQRKSRRSRERGSSRSPQPAVRFVRSKRRSAPSVLLKTVSQASSLCPPPPRVAAGPRDAAAPPARASSS